MILGCVRSSQLRTRRIKFVRNGRGWILSIQLRPHTWLDYCRKVNNLTGESWQVSFISDLYFEEEAAVENTITQKRDQRETRKGEIFSLLSAFTVNSASTNFLSGIEHRLTDPSNFYSTVNTSFITSGVSLCETCPYLGWKRKASLSKDEIL